MSEIVTVDIETLMIDALAVWLDGRGWDVEVSDSLPGGELSEGVALYRTGGVMRDIVTDNPTIAVDAKGRTKTRSTQLINLCRSWAHGLVGYTLGGYGVNTVDEFAGPANLPTEDSPTRCTMTLSIGIQAQIVIP